MKSSAASGFSGFLALLTVLAAGGCGDEPIVDAEALRATLQRSHAGDEVEIGAGELAGPFDVPPGVVLRGQGRGATRIVGTDDAPAVRLQPSPDGTNPTQVTSLTIVSGGHYGLVAVGAGAARASDVAVQASRGAAIGVQDADDFRLRDAEVEGPVTPGNAQSLPPDPDTASTGTHGIVLFASVAQLDNVDVSGFADVGALAVDSRLTWNTGTIRENAGTGLLVSGGEIDLTGLAIRRSLQTVRLSPPYNAVFTGNAAVATDSLESDESEGFGILHAGASASHDGLDSRDNSSAGIWIQDSAGIRVANSVLEGNALAGIAAVDSSDVEIESVDVRGTRPMTRLVDGRTVDVGDGVHLLRATTDVRLSDSLLENNARVGLLLDVDSAGFDTVILRNIRIAGEAEQLGAVAQGGAVPTDWDQDIERLGAVVDNDQAFTGMLDTIGIVGPSDLPAVESLSTGGIAGIVGPSD